MSTPKQYEFRQVDVFSSKPLGGNPLAVVVGADGLSDETMAAFANWTNLSETTFLLKPTSADADYRVRIFTPKQELPFAGHPTLGSCHVWLATTDKPVKAEIVQECAAGLIRIRRDGSRLAFAAPPLIRQGPIDESTLETFCKGLHINHSDIIASNWVDNGPGWAAVLLRDREHLLAIKPDFSILKGLRVGLVAPCGAASTNVGADFEVRAFTAAGFEDPVTGSLNAGIAQWLIGAGIAKDEYIAAQGTVLGRTGRVHVQNDGNNIWIGGDVVTTISGDVQL